MIMYLSSCLDDAFKTTLCPFFLGLLAFTGLKLWVYYLFVISLMFELAKPNVFCPIIGLAVNNDCCASNFENIILVYNYI